MNLSISTLIHENHYNTLLAWAMLPPPRSPCVAFLHGPPGVGKTTLAHRVVRDAGLSPVECNASQFRHKSAMSDLIEPLLGSANVGDYFRPEGRRAMGVILDEIDGMSAGDRGGLTELVRILSKYNGNNVIICISNEWKETKYKQLLRISLCLHIHPPDLLSCASWLKSDPVILEPLWSSHQGDLRKLLQWDSGIQTASPVITNEITRSMSVEDLVMRLLTGQMRNQEDLNLDNNDLNLAGLNLHESLPDWIREHYGVSGRFGWDMYVRCLRFISTSDRQDYYTFFHQHWSLFPLSFQSKIHAINNFLFVVNPPVKLIPPQLQANTPKSLSKGWKYQYTSVLSRQSWLFNQFKYLCEFRDFLQGSVLVQHGGLEITQWIVSLLDTFGLKHLSKIENTASSDRLSRWLSKLTIPVVPPCPIG